MKKMVKLVEKWNALHLKEMEVEVYDDYELQVYEQVVEVVVVISSWVLVTQYVLVVLVVVLS